jgi:hypothetical protein
VTEINKTKSGIPFLVDFADRAFVRLPPPGAPQDLIILINSRIIDEGVE